MPRVSLATYLKQHAAPAYEPSRVGPFVTISRQYGCYGFSLGLLLLEIVNEQAPATRPWRVYNREILERLARDTQIDPDLLNLQRMERESLIVDFFRGLTIRRIPSGTEVRSRITTMIRSLAIRGNAVIIGQGGAAATADLPNGLSIRMEAPEEWRIRQIALRKDVDHDSARAEIAKMERERSHLREIYDSHNPRLPAFDITFDCSSFTLAEIAQQVAFTMQLKRMM